MRCLIAASVAALGVGKPAWRKETGAIPLRWLGLFLPGGDAKDFAGGTQFSGEVDVAIPSLGAGRTFFTAGYYQGSEDGRLRMIPLTAGVLFSLPNPAGGVTGNVYFGLGAGAYLLALRAAGAPAAKPPGGFALWWVIGFNPFFFVEA